MASVLDPTLPKPTMPTLTSCISSYDISGISWSCSRCPAARWPPRGVQEPDNSGRFSLSARRERSVGWQAKACPTIFHEVSRAEGPSQQTTQSDRLSHLARYNEV